MSKTLKLVIAALMASMVCVATMLMPILGKLNLSLLRKDKPVPKRRNDEQ